MRRAFRGGRRMGSVISVRRMRGLGQLRSPGSPMGAVVPVVLGAGAAATTVIGLRHLMTPTTDAQMKIMEYAPWIGTGVGLLAALGMGYSVGRPAGLSTAAGTIAVTAAMMIGEWAARQRLRQVASGETLEAMRRYGLGRTGAIVPEYSSDGMSGGTRAPVGALVWDQAQRQPSNVGGVGAYGDVVNLGSINSSAFGEPGFRVAGRRG